MKKNLFTLLTLLFMSQTIFALDYYFSSGSGNDDRSSTLAQKAATPWKTLNKLNLEWSKGTLKEGDRIYFKRGETFSGSITVKSSGVLFGAYDVGARPIITGLETLILSQIGSTSKWKSQPLALTRSNLVTLNNLPLAMARWPNSDAPNGGYITAKNTTFNSNVGTLKYNYDDLLTHPNFTDAAEFVGRTRNWSIDRDDLVSHTTVSDNKMRSITYNATNNGAEGDDRYGLKNDFGFFLQGEEALLDKNTEWWYSPDREVIYWSTSKPVVGSVKAANVANLITTNGQKDLTFENLDFQGADLAIFEIDESSVNVTIQNCTISLSGKWGVHSLGDYTKITNTEIKYCLDEGVYVTSKAPFLWMDHDIVSNIGMIPGMGGSGDGHYAGIDIRGDNSMTQNCQTYLTGYCGIFTHSQADIGNVIQYCVIDGFDNVVNDGGGIYYFMGAGSGRKCLYNIVMNGGSAGYGTMWGNIPRHKADGIYLDQQTKGVEVKYNTVFDCYHGFFFNPGCNYVDVQWNTSFNNNAAQLFINVGGDDKNDEGQDPKMQGNTFKHNIWFSKTAIEVTAQFTGESTGATTFWPYSSIGDMDYNYYERPILENDLTILVRSNDTSLAFWQQVSTLDHNSIISPKSATSESDIRFEYNPTSAVKTISLNNNSYISATGVKYVQDITLQPYTSIILLKDKHILNAIDDSYVRDNTYEDINYGAAPLMSIKGPQVGYNKWSYLKFTLNSVAKVMSAKLRVYGSNTESGSTTCSVLATADNWNEETIKWNNKPASSGSALKTAIITAEAKYYEFDVTSYVQDQFAGDKVVSFVIKDLAGAYKNVDFNTKENTVNPPQLVINSDVSGARKGISGSDELASAGSAPVNVINTFMKARVYPNPVQKSFILTLSNPYKQKLSLQIMDELGRTWDVGRKAINKNEYCTSIDISGLSLKPGSYYLLIHSETKKTEVVKLIVK